MNENRPTPVIEPASRDADEADRAHEISVGRMERVRTVSLAVLATVAVFATLYIARAVLFPIVVAMLLNLLLSPLVAVLRRFWIPNAVGAALILIAFVAVVGGGMAMLLTPAATWIDRAPESIREIEVKFRSVRSRVAQIESTTKTIEEMTDLDGDQTLEVQVQQPSLSNTLLNTSGGILAGVFVTMVLLYFLLAAGDHFLGRLVELRPTWGDKRAFVAMARNIEKGMSIYLFTTAAINVGLGVVIGVAMWLVGLPNPILWGVMAGLLNFVPFVGATVGAVVVFLVGLLEFETMGHALVAPALYVAINAFEANFVTPALIGHTISMNPVMILVSIVVWGWLWGVGGVIIAVPLLAVIKIYCDSFESLRPFGRFLGA